MKLSLSSKIVIAFSATIILGMTLNLIIFNRTTRSGYENFAKENDIAYSKQLAVTLSDYYAVSESWKGVSTYLKISKHRTNKFPNNKKNSRMFPSILLVDKSGKVLINSSNEHIEPEDIFGDDNNLGEMVIYNNRPIGYLYVGTMIGSDLSEDEEDFLNGTTKIVTLVSLLLLLLSLLFTYHFSRKITDPIRVLSKISKEIEAGDYSSRVSVKTGDEIGKLGESFNSMAESLESNDAWRKQIVADSAHELRTPVTLIQGNLEMILDGVYKPDRANLQNIYNETLVLSRLINELQELSDADSGSTKLNIEELNLNSLVDSCLEIFKSKGVKDNIALENRLSTSQLTIDGDEVKLKQVFSNILSNAFRHTPNGGTISISAKTWDNLVEIRIKDSGCGIAKEDLESIFKRFYRTDSGRNRKDGGSGLGLSISKEIVKLHNGSICAESVIDEGTTIVITLPLKRCD